MGYKVQDEPLGEDVAVLTDSRLLLCRPPTLFFSIHSLCQVCFLLIHWLGHPLWSRSLGGLLLQHPGPSPNQTVHHFEVPRAAFKMKHSAVVSSAAARGTCILG